MGHGRLVSFGVFRARKQFAMRLEREQQAQSVGSNEQLPTETQTQVVAELGSAEIDTVRSPRDQQCDRRQKKQARLKAGVGPIVFLHVILEPAQRETTRPT